MKDRHRTLCSVLFLLADQQIAADGGEHRSNVTSFKIKQISYFEDNVEHVMEVFSQLNDKCLKPRALAANEEWKVLL